MTSSKKISVVKKRYRDGQGKSPSEGRRRSRVQRDVSCKVIDNAGSLVLQKPLPATFADY